MMEKIILGFGSNSGKRLNNIFKAVRIISLDRDFNRITLSSIYETEPWGFSPQKSFLNCCGIFLCRLRPFELVHFLQKTEKTLGRVQRGKWQAREIDIDILFYGKKLIQKNSLKIPHPMISARNFVMIPLLELDPEFIHPKLGISVKNLYTASKDRCNVSLFKKRN